MDCVFRSEKDFITEITTICKQHLKAPEVIVYKRSQLPDGVTRTVTIACIIDVNNENLINALAWGGANSGKNGVGYYEFIGSEINSQQANNNTVDYAYVQADVIAINKEP